MECNNKVLANWCNNKDVKPVQMKSEKLPCDRGGNVYRGPIVNMCQQCRKSNNGQIKMVR